MKFSVSSFHQLSNARYTSHILCLLFEKVRDFYRFRLQHTKAYASEAYGIVILSSAINQHRFATAMAATVTDVENHSHHNQSF